MFHVPAHLSSTAAQISIPHSAVTKDFEYVDCGTITLLTPRTQAARSWAAENLDVSRHGNGYGIRSNEFCNVLDLIDEAGLEV